MQTTQPTRPRIYADGTEMRDPLWAKYREVVTQKYVIYRSAGYDHESTRQMIRVNYGTTGHMLLDEVLEILAG
jgi:hypothetical protein